jgi:REP element-mobilizing transposase RayT
LTDHIEALRTAVKLTRRKHPFAIDAVVVLPDHLHIVMTLPDGDMDFTVAGISLNGASPPRSSNPVWLFRVARMERASLPTH